MTRSPRSARGALCALLLLLLLPLLTGCDPFTVPDSAPPCPYGISTPAPVPTPTSRSGTVRFGTSIDTDMRVHGRRTTFRVHQTVAWIAYFSHPIKSGQLYFQIRRDECGRWVSVYTGPNIPYSPDQTIHGRGIVPALRLEFQIIHLGIYQVRYINHRTVVAQGVFLLH
jgi:hypothetical protein